MKKTLLAIAVLSLCACSLNPVKDYQEKKKLVLAPRPINKDVIYLTDAHEILMKGAQNDPRAIPTYVDNDSALIVNNCMDWINLNIQVKEGIDFGSATAATWENAITAALGMTRTNPTVIGAYGIGATLLASTGNNIQAVVAAPADYDVQSLLLGLVDSCTTQLRAAAPTLSFGQAFAGLRKCESVCSKQAAQAALGKAVQAATLVVHPTTNAILSIPSAAK